MIKDWDGFLESVNDEFSELGKLIEKEIGYLNLINDIIIRYQDQYEFSYEFNSNLIFYEPEISDGDSSPLVGPVMTMRKIIKVNDEICLDPIPVYQKPSFILKSILNSPTGYIKYEIFIDGGLKSGDISNMIIDEIRSQYPFTRITSSIVLGHAVVMFHTNGSKVIRLSLEANISDIRNI